MARKAPQLAKLTRPRLHKALARERLFALLDEARAHKPATCVVGPPGAGKTTLVASWLDVRGIKGIWYQVDTGDADLATFFYYLSEAAKPFNRKGERPLPLLTPEFLQDVDGFSRRFFRELFARLPQGAVVVLDNYHEAGSNREIHGAVAQAIHEVPGDRALVMVSRRELPDCFARFVANEKIAFLDWNELRLSREEAVTIASARHAFEPQEVGRLYGLSDGWAAGFTLLLEGGPALSGEAPDPHGRKEVFGYFASEILDRVPPELRQFLLETACLPWVGVDIARELTGNARAEDILEELHRRHLFTHRIAGKAAAYRYHGLFREFLIDRAEAAFDSAARTHLMVRAADLLCACGDKGTAFQLYCDAGTWDRAGSLIVQWAPALLSQGRWQTLRECIERLPHRCLDAEPWLRYWLGESHCAIDAAAGRAELEAAFGLFRERGDLIGQMLCATEVLRAFFFEYHSFERVDPWIDSLGELVAAGPAIPDPAAELRIHSGLLLALISRRPGHLLIEPCLRRTRELLEREADPNLVLAAGISLGFYAAMCGRTGLAEEVAALIRPHLASSFLSPLLKTFWIATYGYVRYIAGDHLGALKLFDQAEQWADEHRLISRIYYVLAWHAYCARRAGDLETAEALADRIQAIPAAIESREKYVLWIRALNERSRGRLASAAQLGWEALGEGKAPECALHGSQHLHQAEMLIELGRLDQAKSCLEAARGRIAGGFSEPAWRPAMQFIEALIALRQGDRARAHARLREGLVLTQGADRLVFTRWYRYTLSHLLPLAFEAGIEIETARKLVSELAIAPGHSYIEAWPWKVRVYSLGRFEVVVDGVPLNFSRKAPKKPIALLKVLVTCGARNVPLDRIVDLLWADDEADSGRDACWLALHRLRKLLGSPEAVQLIEGNVSLDPTLVWVDAQAFEYLLATQQNGTVEDESVQQALALYRGDFLAEESNAAWAVSLRERLRARFVREVELLGRQIEETEHWNEAVGWYLRGLDADPLAEVFYQGLMRCYRAQGRMAEAMSAYRRLRQVLSVTLGMGPSPATESIARQLRAGV